MKFYNECYCFKIAVEMYKNFMNSANPDNALNQELPFVANVQLPPNSYINLI